MPDPLIISIDGGLASQNMFPLYEGGESLSGIGLLFTRTGYYLLTGGVHRRAPYDTRLKILTKVPSPGSIEFDFLGFLAGPAPVFVIGQISLAITASMIFSTGVYLLRKVTGQADVKPPSSIEELAEKRPGDLDALSEAIVSPAKRAHTIINHGANIINIYGENNNVTLNTSTKDYLYYTKLEDEDDWIDASIGWLNANQRTGGAFIYNLGRIVPFDIARSVSQKTLEVLSQSHSDYFLGRNERSKISIKVIKKTDMNGSVKRYILLEALPIEHSNK